MHECRGRSQGMSSSYDSSSDVGSLVRQAANLHQSYCRGCKKTNNGYVTFIVLSYNKLNTYKYKKK